MTVTIRINESDRDALYQYGHGAGLGTMQEILHEIVSLIERGRDRELYTALGKPERIVKPLRNRRLSVSVYSK